MKEIYWIDDDFHMMFFVIQVVIKKLWGLDSRVDDEHKVRSNIIIFGNAWMDRRQGDRLPSQQDEDDAYASLIEWYEKCCYTIDGPTAEKKTYRANAGLVENSVSFLLKSDREEEVKMFRDILKIWTDADDSLENTDSSDAAQRQVGELIEQIQIKEGSVVGLDLSLLCGDYERTKAGRKVISMELYDQLKQKYKCFLYSTDAGQFDFIQKWKETYVKQYSKEAEGGAIPPDIKIYERKFLYEKDNERTVKDIQQLLEVD